VSRVLQQADIFFFLKLIGKNPVKDEVLKKKIKIILNKINSNKKIKD
jgi:hypothetical protein